jgi:coenzyme F420-reducing hydrogenase delta subunit
MKVRALAGITAVILMGTLSTGCSYKKDAEKAAQRAEAAATRAEDAARRVEAAAGRVEAAAARAEAAADKATSGTRFHK